MPGLGYQDHNPSSLGSVYRPRDCDASPDSVIFPRESSFSLFSSASASVDRCSFASDAHDRESLSSDISLHLAGQNNDQHENSNSNSSGPDPDPDPNKPATVHKHSRLSRKVDKGKVKKEASHANIEDGNQSSDSARNSFSLALRECQEKRSRSESLAKKLDRRRPASLDLNNVTASSPRLAAMKTSITTRKSGNFPSPGTPNYRHASVGMQKGWSSERVPSHANNGKRQANVALLPYNNGRALPSKWEDAERWIFSPVGGDGCVRQSVAAAPQRRPKSKSGPLGPPGVAYYSMYSPAVPMFDGGNMGSFLAGSPFSAAAVITDQMTIPTNGHGGAFPVRGDPCMARSVSVHGCSEVINPPLLPLQDGKLDDDKEGAANISRVISRRDMATQMSPQSSIHSSPPREPSLSGSTSIGRPIAEPQIVHSSRSEIRDVQVDDRVTVTRWCKKHRARNSEKSSETVDDWRKKAVNSQASWNVSETSKSISKVKREEAKITAWENLQRAKAEAAIRKLEMKLEKKRSSSIDKIMNKLRSAQKRAQEMRSSVVANQAQEVSKKSTKAVSSRRPRQMKSLSGCFTCHAFL